MTESDVALKIGHRHSLPSRLSHEYNVYTTIAGSRGISQVLWYGKEGVYEVIVLDHLGTSLGDLIDQLEFDQGKAFSYATQMVCLLYKTDDRRTKYTLTISSQWSSHFIANTTSIVTSSPGIS
jgi:casein kinase 1